MREYAPLCRHRLPLLLGSPFSLSPPCRPSAVAQDDGWLERRPLPARDRLAAGGVRALRHARGAARSRRRPTARRSNSSSRGSERFSAEPRPDPLLLIAGGPGQSTVDFYSAAARRVRARAPRPRHHPRRPARHGPLGRRASPATCPTTCRSIRRRAEELKRVIDACVAELDHDPRFYTTSVAVQDLERVRAALGIEQWNVYGVSYGTRVAQHYLRRYPERVRARRARRRRAAAARARTRRRARGAARARADLRALRGRRAVRRALRRAAAAVRRGARAPRRRRGRRDGSAADHGARAAHARSGS